MPIDDKTAALAAHAGLLKDQVYVPAFMGALAEYGIVPSTQKEASALLRMGERLLLADRAEAVKRAEAAGDFYTQAADYLDGVLDGRPQGSPAVDPRLVKRAAAELMGDPKVAAAAAAIQQALIAG